MYNIKEEQQSKKALQWLITAVATINNKTGIQMNSDFGTITVFLH